MSALTADVGAETNFKPLFNFSLIRKLLFFYFKEVDIGKSMYFKIYRLFFDDLQTFSVRALRISRSSSQNTNLRNKSLKYKFIIIVSLYSKANLRVLETNWTIVRV